MSLGDFWFQSNNGKKYDLNDFKELKIEDLAKNPKLQKFIKLFDTDGSGKIEIKNRDGQNEWKSIFEELQEASGDNDLSSEEFGRYLSTKLPNEDLKLEEVNDFLDKASGKESEDCVNDEVATEKVGDEEITRVNGRVIEKRFKNTDNEEVVIKYNYNGSSVEIITDNSKIEVTEVDENGDFFFDDFIKRSYIDEEGHEVIVDFYTDSYGKKYIQEKTILSETESLTKIYSTSSFYMYNLVRQEDYTESMQIYSKNGEEYYVTYNEDGNTVTHAANNDSVDGLISKFGFKDREEFYKLNPKYKNTGIKVTDAIVVPGYYDATSEKIAKQGSIRSAKKDFIDATTAKNRQEFKEENLKDLDQEIFKKLNKLEGLELSNENIGLYFTLNSLPKETQKIFYSTIEKLSK